MSKKVTLKYEKPAKGRGTLTFASPRKQTFVKTRASEQELHELSNPEVANLTAGDEIGEQWMALKKIGPNAINFWRDKQGYGFMGGQHEREKIEQAAWFNPGQDGLPFDAHKKDKTWISNHKKS